MSPFFKILITLVVLLAGLLIALRKMPGLTPPLQRLRERSLLGYYLAVLGGFAAVIVLIYLTASRKVAIFLAIVIVLYLVSRYAMPALVRSFQGEKERDPANQSFLVRAFLILGAGIVGLPFTGSLLNPFLYAAAAGFLVVALWKWIAPGLDALKQSSPRKYAWLVYGTLVAVVLLLGLFVSPKAPIACVIIALGYLLTMKGIPWLATKIGRGLGFKMRPTPLTERRLQRFRRIRRGYLCFVIVSTAFVLSLFLELYVNKLPLYLRYDGESWEDANGNGMWDEGESFTDVNTNEAWDGPQTLYPAVADWLDWIPFLDLEEYTRAVASDYGMRGEKEVPYRDVARWANDPSTLETEAKAIEKAMVEDEKKFREGQAAAAESRGDTYDMESDLPPFKQAQYAADRARAAGLRALRGELEQGRLTIVPTLHPYSPNEQLFELSGLAPHPAFQSDPKMPVLGTDFEWKEVLSQLLYAFRISFLFAVVVAFIGFTVGITVGAIMGYFGGWTDIIVQRIIEVWSSIPFLFTLMIIGSIYTPSFIMLAVLLVLLRAWLGITYTMRGEYYREKARDYVQAARALGVRRPKIMARHIFPNALVPVVTFMPFAIVAYIGTLVSLDYLGFGLGPDTPSWGALLRQGGENIVNNQQLIWWPILAFAATLFCVVMIGEAVREAFDPKLYSRLR